MAKIKIQRLYDSNDCETCGGGSEYGGRVWVDDKLVWEYIPFAGCYDNEYYEDVDLLKQALSYLNIEVEFIDD